MNPIEIIEKYYKPQSNLYKLLLTHSECVAQKALKCIHNRGLNLDKEFVYEAAMLHDIGIFKCNAPSIYCIGDLPYILHGIEGRKILELENMPRHALVCERHTGSGITKEQIIQDNLPLPHRDMLPTTDEEALICYADKFFSKSADPTSEKSYEQALSSISRHGYEAEQRFIALHAKFG